jgi:hypothetical protein
VLVAAAGLLAATACSATTTVPAAALGAHEPALIAKPHTVRLEVDGSDRNVSVLYSPGNGREYGDDEVSLPWSKTVVASAGDYVYVSGSVERRGIQLTCKISVDGTVVSTGVPDHNHSLCSTAITLR